MKALSQAELNINVWSPDELNKFEPVDIEPFIVEPRNETPAPFFGIHVYRRYSDLNRYRINEFGIALRSSEIPQSTEHDVIPCLTSIVPFGKWTWAARHKSLFDGVDTELEQSFRALKDAVTDVSGKSFSVPSSYPQYVKAEVIDEGPQHGVGVFRQYVHLVPLVEDSQGKGAGISADQMATGFGTGIVVTGLVDNRHMIPYKSQRAERVRQVASNVAALLNEAIATQPDQD